MPDIRSERLGAVQVLTIDRPHARNALAPATMAELDQALLELAAGDARVGVITGAGAHAFIAGGDLKELEARRDEEFATGLAIEMRATLDRIATMPVVVIAAVNGWAVGGGAEVAIACDFRIASSDARIGFTQPSLGLMPAWGGVERLAASTGRSRALYLLTSGRVLTGEEARDWGVVEEVVGPVEFEARWRQVAEQVARAPRHVLAGIKAAMQAAHPGSRPDLAGPAVAAFARAWADPAHWEMAADREDERRRARENR